VRGGTKSLEGLPLPTSMGNFSNPWKLALAAFEVPKFSCIVKNVPLVKKVVLPTKISVHAWNWAPLAWASPFLAPPFLLVSGNCPTHTILTTKLWFKLQLIWRSAIVHVRICLSLNKILQSQSHEHQPSNGSNTICIKKNTSSS
jgi:hypothetical protein